MRFEFTTEKTPGKKIEFSKKIIIFVSFINLSIIIYACVMMAVTQNLDPLAYLIPSVAGETAAATSFYYNKAKAENRIKLMKENGIQPGAEDFKEDDNHD